MTNIDDRKDEHIKICEQQDVQYKQQAGFYDVEFVHNALTEINLEAVDTSFSFLGKKLRAPILISGMTGGTKKAGEINKKLAEGCEQKRIAFGLGSCRPFMEDEDKFESYDVRDVCPSVPLLANIGAVQIKQYEIKQISDMVEKIGADALNVHLNPLQEAIQPEGETDFRFVLKSVEKLCENLSVPVIVKETGAGISSTVAIKLASAGVKFIEISGRGGTSWSKVEYARGGRILGFEEWGNPSVPAIAESSAVLKCIASGGIRSGMDIAKSIALGAYMGAAAMPFLRSQNAAKTVDEWIEQIRTCMFLVGARNLDELKQAPILISGKSAQIMKLRGVNPQNYAQREIGVSPKQTINTHYI